MATTAAATAAPTGVPTSTLSQSGVLGGRNPFIYSSSDPLALFIVQSFIIITLSRLLHWPLSYLKQPRVIAEVITGIILGPSVMGHVPNFTNTIFPTASIPNITVVANLGLIMFLFIVGLEVDLGYVRKNLYIALTVGALGMLIPFGLGFVVAIGIYNHEAGGAHVVNFGVYSLFVAVALSITALPVLARILTELRLLRDRVGVIVLSAGIANDLVGWILLALTITLANSTKKGINALYIVLLVVAWFLLLYFGVRKLLTLYLRKSGGFERGPSQFDVCAILILVLVSSFYTDIIGVHPIFGAFIVGVIIPRENDFVVKLTEKIEDFVTVILIPQYFALAGLSANIGLLNDGKSWGYVIAIIAIAFIGKVTGGTLGSRLNGLKWQESLTVGVLMSCKGIVEIVVLTTGLNAHIISAKVFTMFIVMTLVTTFLTTPLTMLVYPVSYRQKLARARSLERRHNLSVNGSTIPSSRIAKIIAHIRDAEAISVLMTLVQLFSNDDARTEQLKIHGVRLCELSQRPSNLIQVTSDTQSDIKNDSLLSVVSAFSQIHNVLFSGDLAYITEGDQASYIVNRHTDLNDLILLTLDQTVTRTESPDGVITASGAWNTTQYPPYFHEVFGHPTGCNLGLFIDRGISVPVTSEESKSWSSRSVSRRIHAIISSTEPNDKLTLHIALQLTESPFVQLTVDVIHPPSKDGHNGGDDDATINSSESWDYVTQVVDAYSSAEFRSRVKLLHSSQEDLRSNINNSFSGEPLTRDIVIIASYTQHNSRSEGEFLGSITQTIISDESLKSSIFICQQN
ncbi:Kha1p [Sugiyamaella lignohabitans]|uniref:Kha1p n=1 Tax=Sugiyamaella lignohabitans TaxID=796027 RepID=A0A167FNV1_9ASCO|nr:Kha1p [Sugiyamaella lignohabitans]ANB15522.1 Kha1p [Sugiyamaella lignohabitans]